MQWFRLHDDVLDDPKVQRLSPATFKHWINLLCLASKNNPRGVLPDIDTISFRLRLSRDKALQVIHELSKAGLIDGMDGEELTPHNWNQRQYGKPSDHPERVAERVRKHRNAHVTPPKRAETPLYTDTDTDTDTEQSTPLPPKTKALPENGEAQKIVAAYCREARLDQPADYKKSVGIAERMVKAGVRAVEIPDLFLFVSQWSNGPDLSILLGSVDKWRAGKNLPPRASPRRTSQRGMSNQEIADYVNGVSHEQNRDRQDAYDTTGRVVR